MKRLGFLLLAIFAFEAYSVLAQPQRSVSVIHDLHKVTSSVLNEERTVLVRVPTNYANTDTRYPVLYMLDAHAPQNAMAVGIVEQQAWSGQIPEMIIVGIQNTNRTRDLTPTKTQREGTGGGEKFLDFLEKEVIPLIEQNYRTQPYRVFAGHSLGGLLVTHTLLNRPQLFNAYIAASPILHWDNDLLIKRGQTVFSDKRDWNRTYFAAIGDEPTYQKGFDSFRELVKKSNPGKFAYEFQQFETENHGSVVLPAYYAGLRKVFAGWVPPAAGTVADLEAHYKKLTARFGYSIPVPEDLMNRAGYELLNANRGSEAIEAFKKNTVNYPRSSNTFDSLGEAYEKTGDKKAARESYKKAHELAVAQGDAQRAAIFKTNLDRVSN